MITPSAPSAAIEPPTWQRFAVALVAVAFVLWPFFYAPAERDGGAVGGALVRDGQTLVATHPQLRSIAAGQGGFGALVASDWWGGLRADQPFYRPLSSAVLGTAAWVAGKPYDAAQPGSGAMPFKLFSLALHAIAALLVVELGWRLMRKAPHAIAAGLLYAALPIHADVLFDAGGIAVQLGTVLSLAALCAWFGGRREDAGPNGAGVVGAALLALVAALAHEIAFVLPVVVLALETARARTGGLGEGLRVALGRVAPVLAIVVGLGVAAGLRFAVGGALFAPGLIDPVVNPLADLGALDRIANGLRMAAAGVPAMVGIDPLASRIFGGSPDHGAAQVTALSAFSPANLIALVVLIALAAAAAWLFPRCRTRGALAIAVLAVLVLASNTLFVQPEVFSARLLLLPGALLALFLAPFFGAAGRIGLAGAGVLAIGSGVWLNAESRHWEDPTSLWRHVADHTATKSARAHTELGGLLLGELLYSMGQNSLDRAIALAPQSATAQALLGEARAANFDPQGAATALRAATELQAQRAGWTWSPAIENLLPNPTYVLYRVNQLELIDAIVTPEEHLAWLDRLLARGFASPSVELYRARTLLALNRAQDAEAALRSSLAIAPTVENVRSLGRLLLNTGRADEAQTLYREMTPRFGGQNAAEAELLLHQAGTELALDPTRALELATRLLANADDLNPEQRFQAYLISAQARIDSPADPVEAARRRRLAVDDLTRGLAGYHVVAEDTYFALHMLGQLLFAQGRYDQARDVMESVLRQREGATQRWMLGTVLARSDNPREAVRQLDLALAGLTRGGAPISPAIYIAASIERLRALAGWSEPDAAPLYAEALAAARHPEDREAVARHLATSGRAEEALAIARELAAGTRPGLASAMPAFERAVILDRDDRATPGNPGLLAERSSLRIVMGDPIAALADARTAVDATPAGAARGKRLMFLAEAQAAAGELEAALSSWRAAADDAETPAQDMPRIQSEVAILTALLGHE